jgi:predicted enzyme related to lactoylglutathione lyase
MSGASAVVYVVDLDRMRAFYEGGLGLSVAEEGEGYCTLTGAGWTLSLVVVPTDLAASIQLGSPPARRTQSPIKLGFAVASVDALVRTLAELGGSVDPPSTAWAHAGVVHRDAVDPEGNVVDLLQPAG